jgi:hypothetical protein
METNDHAPAMTWQHGDEPKRLVTFCLSTHVIVGVAISPSCRVTASTRSIHQRSAKECSMTQSTPWAILLTKWSDHATEPRPRSFFENLFTTAGTGSFNMTDYFDTMSHGTLDLSGSAVHGWFTLDQPQSSYVGNSAPGPGQLGRNELLNAARAKAAANGVNLSAYSGVVVCMNTLTDLCGWLGGWAALCDPGSFQPTVLGQEMGHGYGLVHSRVDGSTADYQDPWDTMSTWDSCYFAGDPNYGLIGPGMNAANMRNMGWLDETRVWKPAPGVAFSQTVELRPLHSRGLPGHLAIELPGTPGGFLVEFRVAEDWDIAFPRPAVFVHRLDGGYSYRMLGTAGNSDLVDGDEFVFGTDFIFSSQTTLRVDEINPGRHHARVTVGYRPGQRIHIPDGIWGQLIGGVAVDGGGAIIINGRPHPVDPWGPLTEITKQLVVHGNAEQIAQPIMRLETKRAALARIVDVASAALDELNELERPPDQAHEPRVTRKVARAQGAKTAAKKAAN